ncbi:MAG: dihydrodipicolinate synthase family protein [Desulfarculaceae bacterium]|nr:dihydrodipicolinate synthase family protein [Desulfarculaceae bacterium]MCF8048842.1 dihydrodipicolinate synthase family protein [Desulfarculaceae bacterium]MCF8065694.1 dihydrodipicolinate synthase family protein [Desulfarculaceae bacterium]MCF8099155.1 dihydrodipicolinate synthase family protein [Desulfarculaceae bacterium]MCF8122000.1 dihydrodipicolinate synthase family protein [Desulfarculaceae bacterium]
MKHKLQGVLPPMATPFTADEALDLTALKANITKWNATGLSGYLAVGSNGESVYLSEDEQQAVIAATVEAAAEDKFVMAGAGRESSRETIGAIKRAASVGADCALIVTPCYFKGQMKAPNLEAHYLRVAEASPLPILLYNVPQATQVNMEPDLVARLAPHPNITGIKDSSGNIAQLSEILRLTKDEDFAVFVGNAEVLHSATQLGADGAILAVANVMPQECVDIMEAVRSGDLAKGKALQWSISRLAALVTRSHGVGGLKATMDMVGYYGGPVRLPLLMPGQAALDELAAELKKAMGKA